MSSDSPIHTPIRMFSASLAPCLALCLALASSACSSGTESEILELRDGEVVLGCVFTDVAVYQEGSDALAVADIQVVDVAGQPIPGLAMTAGFASSVRTFALETDASGQARFQATLAPGSSTGSLTIEETRFSGDEITGLRVVRVSSTHSSCEPTLVYSESGTVLSGTGSSSATQDGTGSSSATQDGTGSSSATQDGTGSSSATQDGTGSSS